MSEKKPPVGKLRVFGKDVEYVGNPSPKMLDDMTTVLEDIAMGRIRLPDPDEPPPKRRHDA